MFFALELAGASLVAYYNHNSSNVVNQFDFLYNILKGAASALEQFNRHAIHFDIKQANFVVALGQNVANPVVSVKLIDFNRSILLTNTSNVDFRTLLGMFIAPEIRGHNRNMECCISFLKN
uniref:Protein kinase domain-containing protein n=1 Tax=Meloidogyne incognita TaxID=6306 RepID=A0A914MCY5_MELIC